MQQRAAIVGAPATVSVEEREIAAPKANELLIKVEGCGVCASSLPDWQGREWTKYPLPPGNPGHEPWGRVVECGSEVGGFKPGQRVAFLTENGFADYDCTDASQAVLLPDELEGRPFPGEAIGCAMNIFRRADIQAGQDVAIVGAGFLGLLLVQLAVGAGANVHVLSRRQFARDKALEFGATTALDTEDWWGNACKIVEKTNGVGCQRVIEVTGLQFALDTATEMIAEYGKLIIAGFHQDGLRQVNMQTWNWRAIDVINAHERAPERYVEGMRAGIKATLGGRISPESVLTHKFSLAEVDKAFSMMEERPDGFIKGWIEL
ncbi:zinc-binding dehydrogenase [Alteromonas pelagimontana]|uniref:Zinc-binding dehydrogenase n=2 Tax=Alteromonas pelagimontana TaxID=1858656 RepID=A0A6M4MI52_9ALTE|nr:zinc-binding dehydrogenase [Alteromonas pelagimontana]